MRIIDTILFWNELDILELRLSEHYDHVDEFVIIECDYTFTNIYKGYILEQNKERYKKWWDKIRYFKVTNPNRSNNPWDNEVWQRGQFSLGWENLDSTDVIIVSDVDEIIRPSVLDQIRETDYDVYVFHMALFYLRYNYLCLSYPWSNAKAFRGFREHGENLRQKKSFHDKRVQYVEHAGWHFSWLGNDTEVVNKIKSFSHYEFNTPDFLNKIDISQSIQKNRNHFDMPMAKVTVDHYFPKSLLTNIDSYKHLILSEDTKTVKDYFPGSY